MTTDPVRPDATEAFEEHRSTLIGAAYRILGSRVEAEDVVQEAWIRWSGVDHDTIDQPRAYLLTITTRLALNRLRTLATRRESYVGPVAARAGRQRPGPARRRRCGGPAGRRGVHGDADRAGVAEPARACRVRAHRGVRHGRAGGGRGARPQSRRQCGSSSIAPGRTWRPGGHARSSTRSGTARSPSGSWRLPAAATSPR